MMSTSDERHQAAGCLSGEAKSLCKSANSNQTLPSEPKSKSSSNHDIAPCRANITKVPEGAFSKKLKKGNCEREAKEKVQEEVLRTTSTSKELEESSHDHLPSSMQQHDLHVVSPIEDVQVDQTSLSEHASQFLSPEEQFMECNLSSDMITVKKGVLWQQQDHDKFHQRLFSRWKRRFFILTTDYLVCFKRSTTKVGRSEMGKFLYKTSLGDILAVEWLRPKKSDKGPIILRARNQFKLFLWTKNNLEDWMTQINAMRLKRKLRNGLADGLKHGKSRRADNQNGIYENAALPSLCDAPPAVDQAAHDEICNGLLSNGFQPSGSVQLKSNSHDMRNVLNEGNADVASQSNQSAIERIAQNDIRCNQTIGDNATAASDENQLAKREVSPVTRPPLGMINDDRFLPGGNRPLGQDVKNPSGDDFVTDGQSGRQSFDQPAEGSVPKASKVSLSSSIRRGESHGNNQVQAPESHPVQAICRDSNDNLVSMSFDQPESDSSKKLQDCDNQKLPLELREKHNTRELGLDLSREEKHSTRSKKSDTGSPLHEVQMQSFIDVGEPSRRLRPAKNLIRRDESWHSMLSLNQYEANQDALQANPTSHGCPGTNIDSEDRFQRLSSTRRHIESTVTPLRERPFVRQQSMQMNRNRRLPSIDQLQANSFDVNHNQISTPLHCNSQPQQQTSYHQKLIQLQLLHNSSADYAQNKNEQQIYGPGSIATTTHYGYYSMRSNLRSAASEFSFIRPGSSNLNSSQPQVVSNQFGQKPIVINNNFCDIPNGRPQFDSKSRSSVTTPDWKLLLQNPNPKGSVNHMSPDDLANLMAPNRDLPLKPNKKRLPAVKANQKGSSSAIGSGIVQFFRRAFSRQSKQGPKLAESCSTSLRAPFDDNFESMQRARSAFSTTGGNQASNRSEFIGHQQQTAINQQHRMIDLIEAFAKKTTLDTYDNLARQNHINGHPSQFSSPFRSSIRSDISVPSQLVHYQQKPRNHIQQQVTNSPLHKSNSISTSTGLSGLNEMMRMNEHRMLVRGPLSPSLAPISGLRSSPLITRSTKVMSVNLTPISSRREANTHDMAGYFDQQPPRPSSIYGQPSMISSPISINGYDLRRNDRVSHRANLHQRTEHMSPLNVNLDTRRFHHQMRVPALDTTREVAEEVSTPTTEFKPFPEDHTTQNDSNTNEMTPMGRNNQQKRQRPSRIVNPILQSPTMNFIYDNHPAPRIRNGFSSHYDNPRTLENQQSMSSMNLNGHTYERRQGDRMIAQQEHQQRQSLYYCADVLSPQARNYNLRQQHTINARDHMNPQATPSHCNVRLSHQAINADTNSPNPEKFMGTYTKPSKLVYPSTPTSNQRANELNIDSGPINSHIVMDQRQPAIPSTSYSRSGLRPSEPIIWPSPIRVAQHQYVQQHQRSPLVNRHTRVLKRNDGVQATFIEPDVNDAGGQLNSEIKTAIGSMDKTSHAILPKYGSSTTASDSSDSSSLRSTENQFTAKTPLGPSCLSKSNCEPSTNDSPKFGSKMMSNENHQPFMQLPVRNDETPSRSTSSGTDLMSTSSSARSSSSINRKSLINNSSNRSQSVREKRLSNVIQTNQEDKSSDGGRRSCSSSTEHSEENVSQIDGFNDHTSEGRKWVRSKLMQ